jgi:hypothetical protein
MSEFDDQLTRLFAEARDTPPAEDFLRNLAARMQHERRRRTVRRTVAMAAAAGLAVASTPYIAQGSLTLASDLGSWLAVFGNALTSPAGWACALAAAAWGARRARNMS